MIINLLIGLFTLILGAIFSWLPQISTLPTIGGFDIDGALVLGMGQLHTFMITFWPIDYLLKGFMALMVYYGFMIILRFFIGHRAPGNK